MIKKIGKVLILDKTDFITHSENKLAIDLSYVDLRNKSAEASKSCDLVIATTSKGETIILKNRNGIEGIVVPLHTYTEFLNWLDENNKPNITPQKESLMGRILKFNFWPFNRS